MCDPISLSIAGAAILGSGASYLSSKKAAKTQKAAITSNENTAAKEAQRAEQAYNKINQKMPDLGALFSANKAQNKGLGGTFLTGAGGVNPASLPLGGVSLLGM